MVCAAALSTIPAESYAQTDEQLKNDIIESGYVHKPLKLRKDKALETALARKKVLVSDQLCNMESLDRWSHDGHGRMFLTDERCTEGKYNLRMEAESATETKVKGMGRGSSYAIYNVGGAGWSNHLHVGCN